MSTRAGWILLIISCLIVVAYALHRDLLYERAYTGDLRNRIVGSRMIEDGRSPYFYKWQKGDPIRYYDPTNFDTLKASIMTSTPFLHRVFYPIADLPQARISKIWLAAEYILFICMTVFAFSLARTNEGKMAVVLFFILFLLSNAWKKQMANGQTYIWVPSFAMLFFFFFRKNKHVVWTVAAGIAAVCLLLTKPNTLVFFIPFLFQFRQYSRARIVAFFIPLLVMGGWILLNSAERGLWQDYGRVVSAYTDISQGHAALQHNDPDPQYPNWEGIDMKTAAVAEAQYNQTAKVYSENGNFFVLWLITTHHRLPVPVLGIMALAIVSLLILLFYRQAHGGRTDVTRTAIFGFCLYMVTDLFSPVYRHQYYTVQWIFPLLLAASLYTFRSRARWAYNLLLAGLLLSVVHLGFIKMENTIGEYLFMASLLVISFIPGPGSRQESTPV